MELNNLDKLSAELGALLHKNNMFFTSAESCTGGLLSQSIVSVPGSSGWFGCSFVTYSNKSKHKMLGVSKDLLKEYGAVSEEVVKEMVSGALDESSADIGVAISGIAGPGGGSVDRPVGTVCIAWKLKNEEPISSTFLFDGERNEVRFKTVSEGLEGAINLIK